MKFFWFRGANNYGDVLTPYLCQRLGIKCIYSPRKNAQAIMVGSIANHALPGMNVFGSGFIRRNDIVCPEAKYHWVRGPISRQMIIDSGGDAPELYGDAALLLPDLIKESTKVHDIGFVPHHVDFKRVNGFKVNLQKGSIENITKSITSCRKVISSSLHGIIVAHAYGIPAAWIKLSDELSGDGMKFHDHYESVGLKAELSTLEDPIFQVPTKIETSHILRILKEI